MKRFQRINLPLSKHTIQNLLWLRWMTSRSFMIAAVGAWLLLALVLPAQAIAPENSPPVRGKG